eukprot:GFUD01040159.1.p1 GENE.GFUD01040159.1~~GFUD01040159.1.p1  ORF type:complete len:136 (-),score=23.64 GFUD01040159.1:53-460(-)
MKEIISLFLLLSLVDRSMPCKAFLHQTQSTDCELGWTGSGGSCYKRFNGSEQNCLETCKGHGGELADINSRKENEFIMSLMDKDGLAYISGGNYANWGPGGGPPEGPCALLEVHNDGIWWRTDCSMFNSCICEVI